MGRPVPHATVGMVWAQTPGGVIAVDDELPWDVPEDFRHFRDTVAGRPVVVGRTTWDSMPGPWRRARTAASVVVTRDPAWHGAPDEHPVRAGSLPEAIATASLPVGTPDAAPPPDEVWIMGGGQVYAQGIAYADLLVVSEIDVPEPGPDAAATRAPAIDEATWRECTPADVAGWRVSRTGTGWRILHYRRR
ncbi:dihydrofolate reductase [Salana multivorans]|uniref:dihydrofolate reductase n=1 Tax=Salana multivorans TaxID=120377 RepID=A0A3N2DCM8_9MICO|nr:dihydrofolate reductase [Salana multivorans]ROR97540.1 dihydrofolate reductase [Salana multivorans]